MPHDLPSPPPIERLHVMRSIPLELPEKVRRKAESLGETGLCRLANLARHVAEIEDRWSINVVRPSHNGTEAFVAEAVTADGQEAVLKIVMPSIDHSHQEIRTLRAAMGRGYTKLIRADDDENVMLLERLGAQLHELGLAEERQIEIICATLREAWMPVSAGPAFMTADEKATELAQIIASNWSALRKPCAERTIDLALSYAEKRSVA